MDQETVSEDVECPVCKALIWEHNEWQLEHCRMQLKHQTIEIGYRVDSGADRPVYRVLIARVVEESADGIVYGTDILHKTGAVGCKSLEHAKMLCNLYFSGKVKELTFRLHPVLERYTSEHQ